MARPETFGADRSTPSTSRANAFLVAEVTRAAVLELGLIAGASVWIAVKATEVSVYPA